MFEHSVDVRWRDVDALDHVNHAVFLTYLEEGRDAFYTRTPRRRPSYVVVRLEVDLRAEVRYPDRRVTGADRGGAPGHDQPDHPRDDLTPAGANAAEARVVTVHWDAEQRKPVPWDDAERARLT